MEHIQKIIYLVSTLMFSTKLSISNLDPKLIVWNTGQGQWVTRLTQTHCLHFDAGGDRKLYGPLKRLCKSKTNQLYLTHLDKDHINQVWKLKSLLPNLCLASELRFPNLKSKKYRQVHQIKKCQPHKDLKLIYKAYFYKKVKSMNSLSQVFFFNGLLVSGDSESKQEKKWTKKLSGLKVKYFILGHHGSNTSNSKKLLNKIKNLDLALGSSRKPRYGHPSLKVLNRFKEYRIPVVTTNDWGNVFIY